MAGESVVNYQCEDCLGSGESECDCCGSMADCKWCEGTGYDPEQFDLEAWKKALESFEEEMREKARTNDGFFISCDLMIDGERCGRKGCDGTELKITDFKVE